MEVLMAVWTRQGDCPSSPQLNHNLCMYTQGIILHQTVSSADQSVQDPDAPVGLPQSEIERGHIQKLAG